MRKTTFLFLVLISFFLVSCKEDIKLTIDREVTVNLNEPYQLTYETNDSQGLIFESLNEDMAIVDEDGVVTGLEVGGAIIKVSSKTDSSKTVFVNIKIEIKSYINVEKNVSFTAKETFNLNVSTNIVKGVSFESQNINIATVNDEGLITGVNPGETKIKVISLEDSSFYQEVDVEVKQRDLLLEAWIETNETYQIGADIITDSLYTSDNNSVATVDSNGIVTAVSPGVALISLVNKNDENISEVFTIYVKGEPQDFNIDLKKEMLVGDSQMLELVMEPVFGDKEAIFQSYDPSILRIDSAGNLTALSPGYSSIQVTLIANPELSKRFYISVVSLLVVDSTKTENDIVTESGYDFAYGATLFSSISEALTKSMNGTLITIYPGTYQENLDINKGVTIEAKDNVTLEGDIVIGSSNVTIDGFIFKNSKIYNSRKLNNVKITNNLVNTFNAQDTFINLNEVSDVNISYNKIETANEKAISITNFSSGSIQVKGNVIENSKTAISVLTDEDFDVDTVLEIMWNTISNVDFGLKVDLGDGPQANIIRQVVRFNKIDNYETAFVAAVDNNLDLNLNYWGPEGPKINNFENVTLETLDAFYTDKEEIVSEDDYDQRVPVKVLITNPIDEIYVGEEHTIEYKIYPREIGDEAVTWRYSNLPALEVDGATIKGLYTWDVTITLRAKSDHDVFDSFLLQITSDPYIEIVPENLQYSLAVGDTFKLNTNVVPYQIRNEKFIYESSNDEVATVTEFGDVSLVGAGVVTMKVYLEIDQDVYQEFTFRVFDELDLTDPFDFARSTMVMASQFKRFNVFGVNFDYEAHYLDSVSRLLIEEIAIDKSLMIPEVYPQVRPGLIRLKPNLPEEQIYNDAYVQYVVVHETANTNENGGALFHANYLMNAFLDKTEDYKSWHFTVDDKEIYQHIPTDEVAYHAGDGSTVAGSPWSEGNKGGIGGGNRNGIGIETSVAIGDDLMSIWHRVARLASKLSKEYNLPKQQPRENVKFHRDFSGKSCPQSMIKGGYTDFFYGLVENEYIREYEFPSLKLSINSHNLDYLTNNGRIVQLPEKAMTVTYDLTITYDGESVTETFYIYLPGQLK